MGFMDKLRNRFQMGRGKVKQDVGRASGDPYLEAEGQGERVGGAARLRRPREIGAQAVGCTQPRSFADEHNGKGGVQVSPDVIPQRHARLSGHNDWGDVPTGKRSQNCLQCRGGM